MSYLSEELTLRIWGENIKLDRDTWIEMLDDLRPESENATRVLELIAGGPLQIDKSGYGDVVGYHEQNRLGIRRPLVNTAKIEQEWPRVEVLRVREIPKEHPDYRRTLTNRWYIAVAELMDATTGHRAIYGLNNGGSWICFAN